MEKKAKNIKFKEVKRKTAVEYQRDKVAAESEESEVFRRKNEPIYKVRRRKYIEMLREGMREVIPHLIGQLKVRGLELSSEEYFIMSELNHFVLESKTRTKDKKARFFENLKEFEKARYTWKDLFVKLVDYSESDLAIEDVNINLYLLQMLETMQETEKVLIKKLQKYDRNINKTKLEARA